MTESKCPVIMTCTKIPKSLKSKNIKIIKLEKSIEYLNLVNTHRDIHQKKINNIEILYFFRYYKGDLNAIFSNLQLKVILR